MNDKQRNNAYVYERLNLRVRSSVQARLKPQVLFK